MMNVVNGRFPLEGGPILLSAVARQLETTRVTGALA